MATIIGSKTQPVQAVQNVNTADISFHSVPVVLNNTQQLEIINKVQSIDFLSIPQEDIALLCNDVDKEFNSVLDTCLSKIEGVNSNKLIKIVKALSEKVDESKLDDVAKRILEGKPGFFTRLQITVNNAINKKSAHDVTDAFFEETKAMLSQKTATLQRVIDTMEQELQIELKKLDDNVVSMNNTSDIYKEYFEKYVLATAFILVFYEKAKKQVEDYKNSIDLNNPIEQRNYQILTDKLTALENKAITMEGQLTALPTDDQVIRELQLASISTRQDALTTIPARFSKIKMTLIKLNSALVIKGAQDLDKQSRNLDAALSKITSGIVKDVVFQAANAAGENRKAQAEQIMTVVNDTKELMHIAEEGAANNKVKFDEARALFMSARKTLADLNTKRISRG